MKHNIGVCVLATKSSETKSSSFIDMPERPLPPLFCARYVAKGTLFIYPPWVIVTTMSSRAIRLSISASNSASTSSVRLGVPNFSFTSRSSSLSTSRSFSRLARISKNSAILSVISFSSLPILSLSRPVSLCNLRSSIALACISDI